MVRAEIGFRTACERFESDESEKLGIFGASSFDAAIDAATVAVNLMTAVRIASAWFAAATVAKVTLDKIARAMACGMLNSPSGLDV